MFTTRRIKTTLSLLLLVFNTTLAQDERSAGPQLPPTIVTANANSEKVRFAAPGNNLQLRLEVYAVSGDRVFDVEMKRGNVLDWTLQDQAGQRLSDGEYLCVVTVKALTGKLTQRIGSISIQQQQVAVLQADAARLSSAQTQALGPVEADSGMTVLEDSKTRALTVVAHTGREGELISTRGDLSFRTGDFFSGRDTEQMRLTVDGNLGLGTDKPQAKLDVVGTIRASKGIEFADGTVQTTALAAPKDKDDNIVASSTGTQNKVAKWLDNAGMLGDSIITENAGNVGIGNTNPQSLLQVGPNPGYGATSGLLITNSLTGTQYDRGFQLAPRQTASPLTNSILMYALPTVNPGVTVPSQYGLFVGGKQGTGSVISSAAVATGQAANLGATNNTHLLLGSLAIPSGNFAIYDNTNFKSYFKGNIGIGTTTPGYPLTVSGNNSPGPNAGVAEFTNNSPDTGIRLRNTSTGGRTWTLFSSGAGSGIGEGRFNIFDATTDRARFSIDALGNVGIGPLAQTSNLVFPLNVSGSSSIEGGVVAEFKNSAVGTAIIVNNDASAGGSAWGLTALSAASSINPGGFNIADWGANANRLSINSAGRVGIATTAPAAALQVRNTPFDTGSATFFDNAGAMFATASNNGGSTPTAPEPALVLAREGISGQAFANFARFDLKRYENAGTASRTQLDIGLTHNDLFGEANSTPTIMSLRSNGNVGINNTNPQAALDVSGDIKARNLPGVQFSQSMPGGGIGVYNFNDTIGIDELSIFAPTSGFIIVTAFARIRMEPGGGEFFFTLQDLTGTPENVIGTTLAGGPGDLTSSVSLSWVITVTDPTPHNIHLKTIGWYTGGAPGARTFRYGHNLTALFVANRY